MTDGRHAETGFAQDVLRVLSGLDHREYAALRLVYFHDLTQDQAARALGLSRAAVGRYVAHGLHELADGLLRGSS